MRDDSAPDPSIEEARAALYKEVTSHAGRERVDELVRRVGELEDALREIRVLINRPEGKCYATATDMIDRLIERTP